MSHRLAAEGGSPFCSNTCVVAREGWGALVKSRSLPVWVHRANSEGTGIENLFAHLFITACGCRYISSCFYSYICACMFFLFKYSCIFVSPQCNFLYSVVIKHKLSCSFNFCFQSHNCLQIKEWSIRASISVTFLSFYLPRGNHRQYFLADSFGFYFPISK